MSTPFLIQFDFGITSSEIDMTHEKNLRRLTLQKLVILIGESKAFCKPHSRMWESSLVSLDP